MNKKNTATLREYYNDLGMRNTLNCQLYLDLDTGELFVNHEASGNTWLQRDALVQLHSQDSNPDWGNIEDVDSGDYQLWIDDVLGDYADQVA